MNTRERFLAIMNFEKTDRTLLWEMGYWRDTIERWYQEGLPRLQDVTIGLEPGKTIRGENAAHDEFSMEKNRDVDVHNYFGLDKWMVCLPVNSMFQPPFEKKIFEESEDYIIFQDEYGVKKKMNKKEASRPQFLEWPVENRKCFGGIKERLRPVLKDRVPPIWNKLVKQYANRDYPLTLGGYPCGFYGTLRLLMGEEHLLLNFYDDPDFVRDFMNYLADFWIQIWGEALSEIKVDCVNFWEDMAYRSGPLISPEMFREFMLPPYRRVTSFLKESGVKVVLVDNDGNLEKLIPLFLESGITGIFPFEVQAGNDIVTVRKKYPRLQILGGIDKLKIAEGKKAIDEELDSKVPIMIKSGGYIPHIDHNVHPDVSWADFSYYRHRLNEFILEVGHTPKVS
jgi:uroporphyrinogen decarboxylase